MTFNEMYAALLRSAAGKDGIDYRKTLREHGRHPGLDCLLHPEKYAPVWKTEPCDCGGERTPECVRRCIFSAISRRDDGSL
jgi:hypothetical protein